MKRVFERVTDTVREVCEEVTKTMVETVEEGKKAFAGLNEKNAEVKNDRDSTASFLARTLPYFSLSDKKSQFTLFDNPNWIWLTHFL